jgi:hypothetical protein
MWEWDCSAPGRSGGGVRDDEERALQAAEAWMREHRASAARVAPVLLDVVELAYVPAGQALEAVQHGDNRITWRQARLETG